MANGGRHPTFSIEAEYHVSEKAPVDALINDQGCLLVAVRAILSHVSFELGEPESNLGSNCKAASEMLYGALYLADMVSGLHDEIARRV